jgi:hypothetical protein
MCRCSLHSLHVVIYNEVITSLSVTRLLCASVSVALPFIVIKLAVSPSYYYYYFINNYIKKSKREKKCASNIGVELNVQLV